MRSILFVIGMKLSPLGAILNPKNFYAGLDASGRDKCKKCADSRKGDCDVFNRFEIQA